MGVQFSNNASTRLRADITPSSTILSVDDASDFPPLGTGDYTFVTLVGPPGLEVVRVTGISVGRRQMVVVRAQDGTTAKPYSTGDGVELRMTAALLRSASEQMLYELYRDSSDNKLKCRIGGSSINPTDDKLEWWIGQGETFAISATGHLMMTL